MNKEKIMGIDLGTTTCAVALSEFGHIRNIANQEGKFTTDSCICFTPDGDVLIGESASNYRQIYYDRTASHYKRSMGISKEFIKVDDKTYSPQQLSSMLLKRMKENVVEESGEEVNKAVVTVPANFGTNECAATREAAEMAGIEVVSLLKEPVAAALWTLHNNKLENLNKDDGTPFLITVLDEGGGTTDISVLSYDAANGVIDELASGGDNYCGSEDINVLLKAMVKAKFFNGKVPNLDQRQEQELTNKVILAKERLSSRSKTAFTIAAGEHYEKKVKVELTRENLEECLEQNHLNMKMEEYMKYIGSPWKEKLERFREVSWTASVVKALTEVDLELKKKLKDSKELSGKEAPDLVIIAGGPARMPLMKKIVHMVYPNVGTLIDEEPQLAVSRGAALFGQLMLESKTPDVRWNADRKSTSSQTSGKKSETKKSSDSAEGATEQPEIDSGSNIIVSVSFCSNRNYGVKAELNGIDQITNILMRGQVLPAVSEHTFYTKHDKQKTASIQVYENLAVEKQAMLSESKYIGECELAIKGDLPAHSPLCVQLTLETDGIHVYAYEETGKTEVKATMHVDSLLTEEEFEAQKREVEKIYEEDVI